MKTRLLQITSLGLALAASALVSRAAPINLIGNDGLGNSSFNSGLNWSGGAAPSGANDYNTAAFQMRTPGDGVTAYTFAGASLTLGNHASAGAGNGSVLEKFTGGSGSTRNLTINNLTNATGGLLRSGGTAGALIHIAGNYLTIAGTCAIWADQCVWVIDVPLVGGDGVILTNFANNATDHVGYTANNAAFTGSWYLQGGGNQGWSLELDGLASLPGNPATLNPGQITFINLGQLRDTVGCSYTNSNGGITLAANGIINASATTLIGVPITDLTNGVHSLASLTSSGSGTLILSNANNNYAGGTIISAGTLQLGVDNAIPGNTVAGDVTVTGTLDLNTHSATINGLTGAGTVDSVAGGAPILTIGANGNAGTFTGNIQNSSGTLSLVKMGPGTETLSGAITYSGATTVSGGTLALTTALGVPATPGDLNIGPAVLNANASSATLPVNNLNLGINSALNLTLGGSAAGLHAAGSLTLQDNASVNLLYGALAANPTAPGINVAGGLSAPGTNIVLGFSALGLKTGTFTLIQYTGTPLGSLANFSLNVPLGVVATLVNNTGNDSIDVNVSVVPDNVAWFGFQDTTWDLTTFNWTNLNGTGLVAFRQGDGVVFDNTLTNDFVNPQPTNINLTATFSVYPIPGLVVNSSLPYSFSGVGGLTGPASLVLSNSGSLTVLTSNSFTGGVSINDTASLFISSDSALGASSGPITLNGGTLQMNGNLTNSRAVSMPTASTIGVGAGATAGLKGVISGAGANFNKSGSGTLVLQGRENLSGNIWFHSGTTIIDTGGSITNATWDDVGYNTTDSATLTMRGTGAFNTSGDFNVGDVDSATGTLNLQDSAVVSVQNLFVASANAAGSTASGTVNLNGGSLIERNTGAGNFVVGGRNAASSAGVAVINLTNGYISGACGIRIGDYGTGTINQYGGTLEVTNGGTGLNLHRENTTTSFGNYNLNGGTLRTEKVTSSVVNTNSLFYFNGGTLQAGNGGLGGTPFMNLLYHAYVRNGGAVVDSQVYNITISQALEHSAVGGDNTIDGGLTKKGSGTLTLTGTNTFTGPLTNSAGTLVLNSASTYSGGLYINAGTVQMTTANTIPGGILVSNNGILSISQVGSATATLGNVTLNGAAGVPGATVSLAPTLANNPAIALVNCGTLTCNGTNSINLPVGSLGTIALINYTGALAGSGTCTNLILPQGALGYVSNYAAGSTLYAVITSTGPGIVWTGTNSAKPNLWDINSTTNWLLGATPTSYHQVVVPGDIVTFNDVGSGTVVLSNNVAPASLLISNNTKAYAFNGSGNLSGPSGLLKLGTGTATLNLSNDTFTSSVIISNGILQVGTASAVPANANLLLGPSGTLELAGISQSAGELTGAGVVSNSSGLDLLLTVGTDSGGTWTGSIRDAGHGGVALIKRGAGTWVVGGNNRLANGSPFITTNIFAAGTTILTNGASVSSPRLRTGVGLPGSTATLIVDGGTLAVSNDVLAVGFLGSTATMTVNNGTVVHSGGTQGAFGAPNALIVGHNGGTGTLTINGGQVLNSQALWLGHNTGGNGTLHLNGGLLQTLNLQPSTTPATSLAYFNGGTLQAVTNSTDFIAPGTTTLVQSRGLIFDDGGFEVTIASASLQDDPASTGGGLTKQGAGTLYMDGAAAHTGGTSVNAGTLAGIGSFSSPVVVAPTGTIGGGNAAGVGTLTINSTLTVNGTAALRISKSGGILTSDLITGLTTANYGGTLSVINVTADTNLLVAGDAFTLFSAAGHNGTFGVIAGSAGAGLGFSFNPNTGVLTVISVSSTPPPITWGVSGNTLTLSWPADHLGWLAQSNAVGVASPATWFTIPGSQATTTLNLTVDPAQPQVFFRLRHP
jgi:autotransporter-associated beta strand protein